MFSLNHTGVIDGAALERDSEILFYNPYEVVTTVGGSGKANVKFKITFTSADQAVQKKIFQAPSDISWPYLQEKLQSMFSLQRSKTCAFFNSRFFPHKRYFPFFPPLFYATFQCRR